MINFDCERVNLLVKRNRAFSLAAMFSMLIFLADTVTVACVTQNIDNRALTLGLCIQCLLVTAAYATVVIIRERYGSQLKFEVCKILARGIGEHEELLRGKDVRLVAECAGDSVTVKRLGGLSQVVLRPEDIAGNALQGVLNKDSFTIDLSALRGVPPVYTNTGAYLTGYLSAYFAKAADKPDTATITDNMGKKEYVVDLIHDRIEATKYFIKRGLV